MPEITPLNEADTNEAEDLEAARLKYEAEKMTRRAALRKLGITSGMAFFSLFAVDDLARMAIKKMRQDEATRGIAETVAREFNDSGIALAQTRPCGDPNCNQCSDGCLTWNCSCPPIPEGGSCQQCLTNACGRCFGVGSIAASQCVTRNGSRMACQAADAQ